MDIPTIERVKIQAQVLVTLVKALQAELGEEKANTIVRNTLGALYREGELGTAISLVVDFDSHFCGCPLIVCDPKLRVISAKLKSCATNASTARTPAT